MKKELKRNSNYFSRALFCKQDNEEVLLDCINGFVEDNNEQPFKDIEVLSPYNYKQSITDTETIVDVKAKNNNGEIVVVEMQTCGSRIFFNRIVDYWVTNYTMQAEENRRKADELGDPSLRKPKRIIMIAIVDFIMFPEVKDAHIVHKICNTINGTPSTDIVEFHTLELPKAVETIKNKKLALWAIFFGSKNFEEDKIMLAKQNGVMKKAVGDYEFFREDRDFVSAYEKHQVYLTGIEMMKEEALSDGIKQGIEQGAREKAIETAKNALAMNLDINAICKLSGLTEEEVLLIHN